MTTKLSRNWRGQLTGVKLDFAQNRYGARTMIEVSLYCPNCGDRVLRDALTIDMQEAIRCTACFHDFPGADLLTDKRQTYLDYLVSLSDLGSKA